MKANASGPAAKKVREYALTKGIDLSNHRAQEATFHSLDWADVILYMDSGNLARLRSVGVDEAKLKCLGGYVGRDRIPDPAFVKRGPELNGLLQLVVEAAEAFAREVKKETPAG